MRAEITIGTISWISRNPNPIHLTAEAALLSPSWFIKTYLALAATSNNDPPQSLADFRDYQNKKAFRAMTYCHFIVEFDVSNKMVKDFKVVDTFHDGGWTPPFKMGAWPATALSFDKNIYSSAWHQGESSPLSKVRTQARHPNSVISSVPSTEIVLANALIKFRAGSHTDRIGIETVGAPYHVPWAWSEVLLTYASGQFKMYGCGSIFPSHAWYFRGALIERSTQIGDIVLPRRGSLSREVVVEQCKIYSVLKMGAPGRSPQDPLNDDITHAGPVLNHPHTIRAADTWSRNL